MAKSKRVVALHGFLGSANDFALITQRLAREAGFQFLAPNLFQVGKLSAHLNYTDWTNQLVAEVKAWAWGEKVQLVGYSLGGRLALHAYFRAPEMFYPPLLLSTNPGVSLEPPEERKKWEAHWADVFQNQSWNEAFDLWNQQNTFAGTTPRFAPKEGQLAKDLVVKSLKQWSLLNHDFSLEKCRELPAATQWWFGENDQRFLAVQKKMLELGMPGEFRIIEGAGHRLPLDAAAKVVEFLL